MSTRFDPNAPEDDKNGVTPGKYLIGAIYFERRTSKADNEYLRVKYGIIAGPLADGDGEDGFPEPGTSGRTFYSSLSLNLGNSGVRGRLRVLSNCVNHEEEFDVASDADMYDFMVGKGFKCTLKVNESNGYTNHDIARYLPKVEQHEQDKIDLWNANYVTDPNMSRPFGDEDKFGENDGGSKDGYDKQYKKAEAEDNIPF